MRKSREEIIEMFPSYEREENLIEKIYGDIPCFRYDINRYKRYAEEKDNTLSNILFGDAFIWTMNGDFDVYNTNIGKIYVCTNGDFLCGDIDVKYGGKTYGIYLMQMYGKVGLDITRLGGANSKVKGFSNKDGIGSPANKYHTEELNEELIWKVLDINKTNLKDYGKCIHRFIERCREVYLQDKTNYIMNKCFSK